VRRRGPRVEHPPAELLRFDPDYWADCAPAWDPRVDEGWRFNPHQTEAQRTFMRRYHTWQDARELWRANHGWPGDGVDYVRQERAARLSHLYPDTHNPKEQ